MATDLLGREIKGTQEGLDVGGKVFKDTVPDNWRQRWLKSQRLMSRLGDEGPIMRILTAPFQAAQTVFNIGGVGAEQMEGYAGEDLEKTSAMLNPYTAQDSPSDVFGRGLAGTGLGEALKEEGVGAGAGLGSFETSQQDGRWYTPWEGALKDIGFSSDQIQRIKEGETISANEAKDTDALSGFINRKGSFFDSGLATDWNIDKLEKQFGSADLYATGYGEEEQDVTKLHEKHGLRGIDVTDPESLAYHKAFNEYKANLPQNEPVSLVGFAQSNAYSKFKKGSADIWGVAQSAAITQEDIAKTGAGHYLAQAEQAIMPKLMEEATKIANIGSGGLAMNPFAQRKRQRMMEDLSEMVQGSRGIMQSQASDYIEELAKNIKESIS